MRIIDEGRGIATINTRNIPMGMVFSGTIGRVTSIFLRTYIEVVDLASPGDVWEADPHSSINPSVTDYCELDAFLTVGPKGTL